MRRRDGIRFQVARALAWVAGPIMWAPPAIRAICPIRGRAARLAERLIGG